MSMKVKISYELGDGSIDSLILHGSIEEIREKAKEEMDKRGAKDAWSEIIDEDA